MRILGFLILCTGIIISAYYFGNSDLKENILQTNYLCNAKVGNIQAGEIAQALTGSYEECLRAKRQAFLIKNNWLLYVVGLLLFFIGLYKELGDKKK